MKYITNISILMLCFIHSASIAGDDHKHSEHKHGAHQHGVATINLVIEDKDISIEFEASANDIVGFERAPITNQERQHIKNQIRKLNNPSSLFVFNKGTCRSVRQSIDSPFNEKYLAKEHYDIDADYEFTCDSTNKIRSVDVKLFKVFAPLKRIDVKWIVRGKQGSQTLTTNKPRIKF